MLGVPVWKNAAASAPMSTVRLTPLGPTNVQKLLLVKVAVQVPSTPLGSVKVPRAPVPYNTPFEAGALVLNRNVQTP